MRRDALRRAVAPVRPALTPLCLLPLALALCACEPGPTADGAPLDLPPVSADPLDPFPVIDGPSVQIVEYVLASAEDVEAFNARGYTRVAGVLRLTADVPTQTTLPHVREAGVVVVDRPGQLHSLNLPALERAVGVQVVGELGRLALPRLSHLQALDLSEAPALKTLTAPALPSLDTLSATVVPGARWRLPALTWLGTLSWTGGPAGEAPHWLGLDAWEAGDAVWIDTDAQAQLHGPSLDRLGELSVRAPAGSRAKLVALREVTGDVRWAVPDFPPEALTGVDGDLAIEAGATEWPALQVVAGDLRVQGAAVTGVFLPALTAVGGRVAVREAGLGELVWPRLRWVGDALGDKAGPGIEIAACPQLRLVALDDLARVRADEGVAIHVHGNPNLCTPPRFGAVVDELVRYAAACRR